MLLYPNCKINVGLNITSRRTDGYHNIETTFYPTELYDVLEIKELKRGADTELHLTGHALEGAAEDNLVLRVYRQLREEFDLPPVEIFLHKRIPSGAGLGGGSSDAAYTMRALNEMFSLALTTEDMAERLKPFGADCPFFVYNRPIYATGIGTDFAPISLSLKGMTLLLVKPDVFVCTREAYAGVTPNRPPVPLKDLLQQPITQWEKAGVKNDFEDSVFAARPVLAAIKQTLYDLGAVYAAMSGSGSTMFGIFTHKIEEAPAIFKDCFVFQQTLRV